MLAKHKTFSFSRTAERIRFKLDIHIVLSQVEKVCKGRAVPLKTAEARHDLNMSRDNKCQNLNILNTLLGAIQ